MSGYGYKIIGLLRDRNFILALALVLGLLLGQGANWTEPLVLPLLAFVMMLSTTSVGGSLFRSPRKLLYPFLAGVMMSYVVLGGFILLLSGLIPLEEPLKNGFILLAAVPPAVGVIPFTGFLNGDVEFTLIGCLSCYLIAFIFTPIILFSFLGIGTDLQFKLFITLTELIIIPLGLSRALVHTGISKRIDPIKGTIINWCFFLVVYTIVGLNQEVFINQSSTLVSVSLITVATTFLLGTLIDKVGGVMRINPKRAVSMILLGTSKNAGFAAGLALTLFSRKTALPSAIQTISMITYIIYLDFKSRR